MHTTSHTQSSVRRRGPVTAAQAKSLLLLLPQDELAQLVSDAHKDVTGMRPVWSRDLTSFHLIAWYCGAFYFNETEQCWCPRVPYE